MTNGRRALTMVMPIVLTSAMSITDVVGSGQRFHDDDPISREPESQDAAKAQPTDIGLLYELTYNLAVASKHVPSNTLAGNANTIDEVPDSSWFTNRIGTTPVTADEISRGANAGRPPNPDRWVIVREKSSGVNPGFTAEDANGDTWFLSFDSPANPEGDSGGTVVATKLFWALGYNQVETFITTV